MKSHIVALRVAGTVFGVVCLLQILRLLMQTEIQIAGRDFPLWPSVIAVLVSGALCIWMWAVARVHS